MRSPALAFICSGLFPAISAGLLLSGCASLNAGLLGSTPAPAPASTDLDFMVSAINAPPELREKLWRQYRGATGSESGRLRIALLESLPGHSGYDTAAAQRDLRRIGARKSDADLRNLAKLRLAELDAQRELQASNADLQRRLDQIVSIERGLDRNSDHEQGKDNGGKPANIGR
jgi:hypothetical protein